MESITETTFDLLIEGTGLAQSLLALSLSRADRKVIHVDPNAYYGGTEAALSLQDAEEWVESVNKGSSTFFDAQIDVPTSDNGTEEKREDGSKLGFSRAYSLALAPQIIYSKSALLPTLVSSKVYRQLEFLAVGAWWIYAAGRDRGSGSLRKIPGSREDVFADSTIELREKRSLMKFLKFITDPEAFTQALEEHGSATLEAFLYEQYGIPPSLQVTLHALTLSSLPASHTSVFFALPRILRHLSSIGVFGPGFGAVVPKWGGLAEITQVGCRASAVGGGVYMLGQGISGAGNATTNDYEQLKLDSGEQIKTRWHARQGRQAQDGANLEESDDLLSRSIFVVDSNLSSLFPSIADGAPPSACSVVYFPAGFLEKDSSKLPGPIYIMVHSSETGECPSGQTVLYASIRATANDGKSWLLAAVNALLEASSNEGSTPKVLWSLSYSQHAPSLERLSSQEDEDPKITDRTISFSQPSTDLAFDDRVLREVRRAWQQISGNAEGFMEFEDREVGEYDDDA